MSSESIVHILLVILLFISGVQLLRGKWLFLIAGYNTMSKEDKEKVNGKFLGKVVGTMMLVSGLLIAMVLIYPAAKTICGVLEIVMVFGGIIYINVSDRGKVK